MLFLVFPHRHLIGVIEKDVGGHQHRVIEQARRHIGALFEGFFLELDHPLQPVERRQAVEQPAEFTVGAHMALHEHRGALRIDATGQVEGRGAAGVLRQPGRIVGHRDRMQIDHTEKRVVAVLEVDPVADRPQPVAQMQGAGGLDPRQHPRPR